MKITRLCEAFGVMPSAGGLFQQPAGYIGRMDAALRARDAAEAAEHKKNEARNRLKANTG